MYLCSAGRSSILSRGNFFSQTLFMILASCSVSIKYVLQGLVGDLWYFKTPHTLIRLYYLLTFCLASTHFLNKDKPHTIVHILFLSSFSRPQNTLSHLDKLYHSHCILISVQYNLTKTIRMHWIISQSWNSRLINRDNNWINSAWSDRSAWSQTDTSVASQWEWK